MPDEASYPERPFNDYLYAAQFNQYSLVVLDKPYITRYVHLPLEASKKEISN
jgi:hypothetical protein